MPALVAEAVVGKKRPLGRRASGATACACCMHSESPTRDPADPLHAEALSECDPLVVALVRNEQQAYVLTFEDSGSGMSAYDSTAVNVKGPRPSRAAPFRASRTAPRTPGAPVA